MTLRVLNHPSLNNNHKFRTDSRTKQLKQSL